MDLENHITKETYIQLLGEVLIKKVGVLDSLTALTAEQELLISNEPFDEDGFERIITEKEEQIQALEKLDSGFERIYESVKEELTGNKEKYMKQINTLKELITKVTDKGVALQAMEKRNKSKIEVLFAQKRKTIKSSRMSSQTAANYYKTMANQQEQESYFYDKKK